MKIVCAAISGLEKYLPSNFTVCVCQIKAIIKMKGFAAALKRETFLCFENKS